MKWADVTESDRGIVYGLILAAKAKNVASEARFLRDANLTHEACEQLIDGARQHRAILDAALAYLSGVDKPVT